MKRIILALALTLLAPLAQAQIVLGEYSGPGTFNIAYANKSDTRSYSGSCKVALNIDNTSSRFAIEFSVYECGFDYFNDPSFIFSVRDGKLFSGNAEVGQVHDNGVVEFAVQGSTTQTVNEVRYNYDCSVRAIQRRTFNVGRKISYWVEPTGEKTYRLVREAVTEEVQMVPYKEWSQCRAEMRAELVSKSVRIEANVTK